MREVTYTARAPSSMGTGQYEMRDPRDASELGDEHLGEAETWGVGGWSDRFSGPTRYVHGIRRRVVTEVIGALELYVRLSEDEAVRMLSVN